MIAPVNTMQDIATDDQLIERGFWQELAHDELNASMTYCGPFARLSETPLTTRRRPPLGGEHNAEVYTESSTSGRNHWRRSSAQGWCRWTRPPSGRDRACRWQASKWRASAGWPPAR